MPSSTSSPPSSLPQAVRFWDTLAKVADEFDGSSGQRIRRYDRVLLHVDDPGYRHLAADVTLHRVAGVIYVGRVDMNGSPLLDLNACARVGMGSPPLFGKLPSLDHDWYQMFDRALDDFLNRGRRLVAVLATDTYPPVYYDYILSGAAARGLTLRPQWLQVVNVLTGDWVSRIVHLLAQPGQAERPDALFVTNDNFLTPALRGLEAAGCRVPDDIEVLSHWNFPARFDGRVPVRLLGFDARQTLQACIDVLDEQRRGGNPPMMSKIPALFEEEIGRSKRP